MHSQSCMILFYTHCGLVGSQLLSVNCYKSCDCTSIIVCIAHAHAVYNGVHIIMYAPCVVIDTLIGGICIVIIEVRWLLILLSYTLPL